MRVNSSREQLDALANNLRWTWHHPTRALLATLPAVENAPSGDSWSAHPAAVVATLEAHDPEALRSWLTAKSDELGTLAADLGVAIAGTTAASRPVVAYFSPEFGVAAEVAQYSGGLGILAGDHLKAASDLGVPLVGVGLFYRQGFFRQSIVDGRQEERYETIEPADVGARPTGVVVDVPIAGRVVRAAVWEQLVGATRLLLLDTDLDTNTPIDRLITDRLYSGDRLHRLEQELVLGVGGVRALRALGLEPTVFHLNEGHACFLLLELLAEAIEAGLGLDAAIAHVRGHSHFTTHTPVPAGIDRFERELIGDDLAAWAERLGTTPETILGWATLPDDEIVGRSTPFNTAALALELCGTANGVSLLHAQVSRNLFGSLPRAASITGITNGVHARTWVAPRLQDLYDDTLGAGWDSGAADAWARAGDLNPAELALVRRAGRADLVTLVHATTGIELDADGIIIGFARRFATYKRAALLLRDPDGLAAALAAGAQFVFAGKAHPADAEGKAVLAELAAFAGSSDAKGRIALVPDYDITVAQRMYAGSDVWLNNPIRPHEACGTSGEKAALNGGLNCSILDGWWADFWVPGAGWVIPSRDPAGDDVGDVTDDERDRIEAAAMLSIINGEILRLFDTPAWWSEVTTMLGILGPQVTAGRMVADYDQRFYRPNGA